MEIVWGGRRFGALSKNIGMEMEKGQKVIIIMTGWNLWKLPGEADDFGPLTKI